MNILFVSHCDLEGNSARHILSIAGVLTDLGLRCAVCVPADVIDPISSQVAVLSYSRAYAGSVMFPDGRGPDLVHAWTPREMVRKLTEKVVQAHGCRYVVHFEDNEEVILEQESGGLSYDQLQRLPASRLDEIVPEHRSHPVRYREFVEGASGVTAVIDRLLEFKPSGLPSLVFWPGFDPEFLHPPKLAVDLRSKLRIPAGQTLLAYNGKIHQTNAAEVRSLFLAVQALRRSGRKIAILKTGQTEVHQSWTDEGIESGAVVDLGVLPREEVRAVLAAADILVQPGRPDSFNDYRFPSKLPEFFASGKPVILPRTNLGLAVRDGVEALLLDSGDAIEIAQKVEMLMDEPALAVRLGAAGKEFAIQRLSWPKNVAPLPDFYADVLSGGHVRTEREQPPVAPGVKLIAFYLPQFHPIKENDEFWGTGFTEWTNVVRAKPNYEGHYQPEVPADLGYYDLRVPEVLERQAELAQQYGIYGFCFYYYWFAGRRLLERPLETMLASGKPNFPFCICWANENWTRSWDGGAADILIEQDYSADFCERFIRDVIPVMRDGRYIRVDGAPMLLVYRINLIPNPRAVAKRWREICAEEGIGAIHLCAVQSFGIEDPRQYGFDAAVEFPPHAKRTLIDPRSFPGISPDFGGCLEDYRALIRNQLALPPPRYPLYRGAMPAWDNTARRGNWARIFVHATPELYGQWLAELVKQSSERQAPERIVFINAWNEWAEGAYLEPDQKLGHARLEATRDALLRGSAGSRIPR